FGVPLVINETIAARIRGRPSPPEVMASRMRMARIPEGAELVENATGGPQGFSIGNVYVMAGIPSVMRAMISTVALEGGAVVQSRSVTAYLGESQVATGLEEIQDRYAEVDIGSYPFMDANGYGTTLVIRGTDPATLDSVLDEIKRLIVDAGETPRNVVTE
ncbi:MAG: competence/damage-inducible protein A, partial [Gammaproteobacteria bacterium]|nr:competence/damage-inducible protein A [Gammaproteobacteria bacterium]